MLPLLAVYATPACPTPAGCCCCVGKCLHAGCPPCPCPQPPPSTPPPLCPLQKLHNRFQASYASTLHTLTDPDVDPDKTSLSSTTDRYEWHTSDGWRSGFYPGLLWRLANATDSAERGMFADAARVFTAGREPKKHDTSSHDVGFMIFSSFGTGISLDGANQSYRAVIATAANSLATRFNKVVGMTRSWGANDDGSKFEVIIDNLMNLELLFWQAAASRNETMYLMALSHARRTATDWFRPDNSTAHLCVFSPTTGELLSACTGTPQGLSANSTWARGQAWAIYGFTMSYRYSGDSTLLVAAERAAAFFLSRTRHTGGVPPWDFDAAPPHAYPDTSAAAITASALFELADHTGNGTYFDEAVQIITSLASRPGLLAPPNRSAAVLAACEHDCDHALCTVVEADYYLLLALRRFDGHELP
jgi:unsaturated chondroitin disaccharide hydrolase